MNSSVNLATYAYSQGFITVIPSFGNKIRAKKYVFSEPRILIMAGIFVLLIVLIAFYFAQVGFLSSAGTLLEKHKKQYAGLEKENRQMAFELREKLSLENLEEAGSILFMEKAQANFLDLTAPVFVAK